MTAKISTQDVRAFLVNIMTVNPGLVDHYTPTWQPGSYSYYHNAKRHRGIYAKATKFSEGGFMTELRRPASWQRLCNVKPGKFPKDPDSLLLTALPDESVTELLYHTDPENSVSTSTIPVDQVARIRYMKGMCSSIDFLTLETVDGRILLGEFSPGRISYYSLDLGQIKYSGVRYRWEAYEVVGQSRRVVFQNMETNQRVNTVLDQSYRNDFYGPDRSVDDKMATQWLEKNHF